MRRWLHLQANIIRTDVYIWEEEIRREAREAGGDEDGALRFMQHSFQGRMNGLRLQLANVLDVLAGEDSVSTKP